MHLISALFIGLAANLDNLGIGVSYGVQKIRIPLLSNFFIAFLSGFIVALSVLTGHILSHWVGIANTIGAMILIVIGIWVAIHKASSEKVLLAAVPCTKIYSVPVKSLNCIIQITKNPSKADLDANGFISLKEAIALGLTLSFNCMATGVGAGLTGLPSLPVTFSVFLFSLITISAGYWIGWKTSSNRLEHGSQILSGILLILIGIYELFN